MVVQLYPNNIIIIIIMFANISSGGSGNGIISGTANNGDGNKHNSRSNETKFPSRLHYFLTEYEKSGEMLDVVSWAGDGKSFKVHNKDRMGEELLPLYVYSRDGSSSQRHSHIALIVFACHWPPSILPVSSNPNPTALFSSRTTYDSWFRQNRFPSFARQLNLYGFRRIAAGTSHVARTYIGQALPFPQKRSDRHACHTALVERNARLTVSLTPSVLLALRSRSCTGSGAGGYAHPQFHRGRPDLAVTIERTDAKSIAKKQIKERATQQPQQDQRHQAGGRPSPNVGGHPGHGSSTAKASVGSCIAANIGINHPAAAAAAPVAATPSISTTTQAASLNDYLSVSASAVTRYLLQRQQQQQEHEQRALLLARLQLQQQQRDELRVALLLGSGRNVSNPDSLLSQASALQVEAASSANASGPSWLQLQQQIPASLSPASTFGHLHPQGLGGGGAQGQLLPQQQHELKREGTPEGGGIDGRLPQGGRM